MIKSTKTKKDVDPLPEKETESAKTTADEKVTTTENITGKPSVKTDPLIDHPTSGGFGKDPVPAEKQEPTNEPLVKCTVYWANADPKNQDIPIIINTCGAEGRRVIAPGVPTMLHPRHITRLENANVPTRIPINLGSGIYEADNPLAAATSINPGHRAILDRATGIIWLEKDRPRFAVSKG